MWRIKRSEEELSSSPVRESSPLSGNGARLGRTLSIKGELSGNEELILDGEFEGTIDLGESSLTIGPQGRVQADIRAREIIVEGTVRGNLHAHDRLQIRGTGNVTGDLLTSRIVIEDGAYFKGSIDILKPEEWKAEGSQSTTDSFRIRPAPVPLHAKEKLE